MTDQSPTTMNGLLHTPEADLDDRRLQATFATAREAEAARDSLIEAGFSRERIAIIDNAAESAEVRDGLAPDDKSVLGRVREALLPDDSKIATTKAARNGDAVLELRPAKEEVEHAIQIIQASHPSHFDASLERWRNIG